MSLFFVTEPGRPVRNRLPESLRTRRVDQLNRTSASAAMAESDPRINEPLSSLEGNLPHKNPALQRQAIEQAYSADNQQQDPTRSYLAIGAISSKSIISISAEATLGEAIQLMDQHELNHLVIMIEDEVAGLIDLRWSMAQALRHTLALKLKDMELPAFLTATHEGDAHQLARLMLAHGLNAALIMEADGKPLGVVTSTDYLRLYAGHAGHSDFA